MINFIIENYKFILAAANLVFTAILILLTIFKKKVNVIDTIKQYILEELPILIATAEETYEEGSKKKDFVLGMMIRFIKQKFDIVDGSIYTKFIEDNIERILCTPQKKGKR